MKKKILSTLLAVCLFVGMAIPAVFAAASDTVATIDTSKVVKTVAVGGEVDVFNALVLKGSDGKEISKDEATVAGKVARSEVTVTTANPIVATTPNAGKVTGVALGTTTVKVKVGTVETSFSMTTVAAVALSTVTITGPNAVAEGEKIELNANINAGTSGTTTYDWTSSDLTVVEVAGFSAPSAAKTEVTGKAAGTTTLTCKVINTPVTGAAVTKTVTYKVTVTAAAVTAKIVLPTDKALVAGNTFKLADLKPVFLTDTNKTANSKVTITWSLQAVMGTVAAFDTDIAEIKDGVLTVKKAAEFFIAATNNGTPAVVAYTKVTVNGAVAATSVKLDKVTADLEVKKTLTLKATILPANTTDKAEWSTNDAKIATVKDGVVTAVAAGKATITVKVGTQTATCVVTVKAAAPVKPTTPSKPTTNPQTSDSLFANLF